MQITEYQVSLKAAVDEEWGDAEEPAMIHAEADRQIEEEGQMNWV